MSDRMSSNLSERIARARPRLLLSAIEEGREWLIRGLVAAGARPDLVPETPEAASVAMSAADALVLQAGTWSPERGRIARAASEVAHKAGLPVVLTLLGSGQLAEGLQECAESVEQVAPDVICCDANGLLRLARSVGLEGVPETPAPDDLGAPRPLARQLAWRLRCTVYLFGSTAGFVTDGRRTLHLEQSALLLSREADVPSGMAAALIGAALSAAGSSWEATTEVLKWLGRVTEETRGSSLPAGSSAELHRQNLVAALVHSASRVARPLWELLSVYVIINGSTPESLVEGILGAGVGAIQFREKSLPMAQQVAIARRFREQCHRAGALFLVNDRLDLALAVEADGVHLGQTDLPPAEARRLLGSRAVIGASCANQEELSIVAGSDYVGTGPVYSTLSKQDAGAPVGVAAVEQVCRGFHGPVVGIGGISLGRVAPIIRAGACGVSVISAVLDAPDPSAAARALLLEVHHARGTSTGWYTRAIS